MVESNGKVENMTDYDRESAEVEYQTQYQNTVRNGLSALADARQAAQDDIDHTSDLEQEAWTLTNDLQVLKAQVDSFTAAPTYQQAQLNSVRIALSQVLDAQIKVTQGLSEFYQYRKNNDQDAILSHRSLEYLARFIFGEPEE